MGKQSIEEFLRKNRDKMDNLEPSESVWQSIKLRLGLVKSPASGIWWKVAAIGFFILSAIQFFVPLNNGNQIVSESVNVENQGEFGEIEDYYLKQISLKKDLILKISENDGRLTPASESDLLRLKAMYEVLKEEYKSNKSKKLEDAMILNLLVRMDILNQELDRVDDGLSI